MIIQKKRAKFLKLNILHDQVDKTEAMLEFCCLIRETEHHIKKSWQTYLW